MELRKWLMSTGRILGLSILAGVATNSLDKVQAHPQKEEVIEINEADIERFTKESKEQERRYQEYMRRCDLNKDGKTTSHEIGVVELFDYLKFSDINRNGLIEQNEGYRQEYDLDNDGKITLEEACIHLIDISEGPAPLRDVILSNTGFQTKKEPKVTEALIRKFKATHDYDFINYLAGEFPSDAQTTTEGKRNLMEMANANFIFRPSFLGGFEYNQDHHKAQAAVTILHKLGYGCEIMETLERLLNAANKPYGDYAYTFGILHPFRILEEIAINSEFPYEKRAKAVSLLVRYCPKITNHLDCYCFEPLVNITINPQVSARLRDIALQEMTALSAENKDAKVVYGLAVDVAARIKSNYNKMEASTLNRLSYIVIKSYTKYDNLGGQTGRFFNHQEGILEGIVWGYREIKQIEGLTELENGIFQLIGETGFKNSGWLLDICVIDDVFHREYEKKAHELVEKNKILLQKNLPILKSVSPVFAAKIFFGLFSPDEHFASTSTGLTNAGEFADRIVHMYALTEILEQYPWVENTLNSIYQDPDKVKYLEDQCTWQGSFSKREYDLLNRHNIRKLELNVTKHKGEQGTEWDQATYKRLFKSEKSFK